MIVGRRLFLIDSVHRSVVVLALVIGCVASARGQSPDVRTQAKQAFGQPLTSGHDVFQLNETYVAWLVIDGLGQLIEIDVGPKSFYGSDFPEAKALGNPRGLSGEEYDALLTRISILKSVGDLRGKGDTAVQSHIVDGWVRTDYYSNAFIEKLVAPASNPEATPERVTRFWIYFLRDVEGSPSELSGGNWQYPQVCLGYEWFYLPQDRGPELELGRWQHFRGAGPSLLRTGCRSTVIRYDEQGFTIEEPQHIQVELEGPLTVRNVRGRVNDPSGAALAGARFEIKPIQGGPVLRATIDDKGRFAIPNVPDGTYKLKITKNGFQALWGKIVVNRKARKANKLSFILPVGV